MGGDEYESRGAFLIHTSIAPESRRKRRIWTPLEVPMMPSHEFTYPKVSPVVAAPTAHLSGAPRPAVQAPASR